MNYLEKPVLQDGYKLLHQGTIALANAEMQGLRIDINYVREQKEKLTQEIEDTEKRFKSTRFYKNWIKSRNGEEPNYNSNPQLKKYLYEVKGYTPAKYTEKGKQELKEQGESDKGSTDEEALKELGIKELDYILRIRKLKKIRDTYLENIEKETVRGYLHPMNNLHTARTFRSCVAKGSKILVMRDFIEKPNGVPIEEVKKGDYIYCFDDNLNPKIDKVIWAGKTGYKRVIKVHYYSKGSRGYLEVTPEHKIRLVDGSYEQAQNLVGDFRKLANDKRASKIRVLSCHRKDDFLNFTGHFKNHKGIKEHRFIYQEMVGKLNNNEVIHHINENHLDHRLKNIRKETLSSHSRYHGLNMSEKKRQKHIKILSENRHKIIPLSGFDHPKSLCLSKYSTLKVLAKAKGQPSKVEYDYSVFMKYLERYGINWYYIQLRYEKNGNYLWKTRLKKLSKLGIAEVQKIIGRSYYKVLEIYNIYGIDKSRKYANQFGEFIPNNYAITKIEWTDKIVDVYDIEVKKHHNFFANDLCVHNSVSFPNTQNIPVRDPESMQIVRSAIYPRPGHQLMEVDYRSLEVSISACIHQDPTMLKYLREGRDMHKDIGEEIFKIEIDKSTKWGDTLRKATKNGFVFPQFYGDYFVNNAIHLCQWIGLPKNKRFRPGQGLQLEEKTIADHLRENGIKTFQNFVDHLEDMQEDLWNNRFPVYAQWRKDIWQFYKDNGYIETPTGFRFTGAMRKNDTANYIIQCSAFNVLLKSFIMLDWNRQQEGWDTKLIAQIHDSILFDMLPSEKDHIVEEIKEVTTKKVPEEWPWIITPLNVEFEICPVDGNWAKKEKIEI